MKERFIIRRIKGELDDTIQSAIDNKTKPLGALGELESVAFKLARIQNTITPTIHSPACFVFAGDHGLAAEGVSAYPSEVTQQMVNNFLSGGAAINSFCQLNNVDLVIVDAGVNGDLPEHPRLINRKIKYGTANALQGPAMNANEMGECLVAGAELIDQYIEDSHSNVLMFGEMGIGNTASASLLMHLLSDIPLEQCIGRGTGLNDEGLQRKHSVLSQVAHQHEACRGNPWATLAAVGGCEIAMMCGAMLATAEHGQAILVDGFIASAAVLVASKMNPHILDYCLFAHQSDEAGHQALLQHLNAKPILKLNLRLGEGTGAALALPLLQSATVFMNEMASFESAQVSTAQT